MRSDTDASSAYLIDASSTTGDYDVWLVCTDDDGEWARVPQVLGRLHPGERPEPLAAEAVARRAEFGAMPGRSGLAIINGEHLKRRARLRLEQRGVATGARADTRTVVGLRTGGWCSRRLRRGSVCPTCERINHSPS